MIPFQALYKIIRRLRGYLTIKDVVVGKSGEYKNSPQNDLY